MKKRFIFATSLVVALTYLAHSCAYESVDRPPDDGVKAQEINNM